MAQVVKLGNTNVIGQPQTGVDQFIYKGEVVGAATTQLFVEGQVGRVLCVEPGTIGTISITGQLAQTNSTTGAFSSGQFISVFARYQCDRAGVVTVSVGAPTFGTPTTPEIPTTTVPNNRLVTNLIIIPVNRSASNPYPHVRMLCDGGLQTNNWLLVVDVHTLNIKGS